MLFETFPWHLPSALHFGKCALPSPPLPLPLCTLHLHTALKIFSHILKYCSCSRNCPVHRQPLLLQLTSKFPMMSSSAMLNCSTCPDWCFAKWTFGDICREIFLLFCYKFVSVGSHIRESAHLTI